MIIKILGFVDIVSALLILLNFNFGIGFVFFLVMLFKGISSLAADAVGKVYGLVDIVAAFVILFNIELGIVFELLIAGVLIFKGFSSLVPSG